MKTGVDIWVIGTEPVAETGPQETGCRARRGAFHDVMLAVEEIGGVAGVERKFFESGEGSEDGGGPLPAVADELRLVDGGGIPVLEIRVRCALSFGGAMEL